MAQRAKILVIRFSSIGDIVLTTPVIRGLAQQLGAEVHLLTKTSFAGVLTANPHLTKTWTIDKKVSEVLPQLRAEGFTAIVDLHHNLRSRLVKWGLWRVPAYTYNKLNWQKWLLTRWKINRMPKVHIVDRYLATVVPLGVQPDGQGLDHYIPKVDRVKLSTWDVPSPFVALVIGAAHATKRLPEDQLIALCRDLRAPVVLLGGPADEASGTAIATTAGDHVYNLCGKLKLHQSADVLRQSKVVISHDTGLMHMAAALGKDILSVWGNTVPEFGMYPYQPDSDKPQEIFEVAGLACRPCSKIGHSECPEGHFACMRQQNVSEIAQVAAEKL